MAQNTKVEGVRDGRWVRDLFREHHRAAGVLDGLFRVAEEPQVQATLRPAADARVMPGIGKGVRSVFRRAVEGKAPLDVLLCAFELAQADPRGVMGLETEIVVVRFLGQPKQLFAQCARPAGLPRVT
jgi:hypothetical protein